MNVFTLPKSPCNNCGMNFSSMSAFDRHQGVKHRNAGGIITCHNPGSRGLIQYPGGIWDWSMRQLWKKMAAHPDDAMTLARLRDAGYWGIYAAFKFAPDGPLRLMFQVITSGIKGHQNEFTRAKAVHGVCRQLKIT